MLCTSSSLKTVLPQIETILKLKVPIVSTTEELAYPTKANMRYARAIHQLAKKAKVAVLGTGVNPGFVMDALPITLTGVCERVEAIRVDRIQDARIRRLPFQQKIGAGLTREQFQKKVDDGSVRHVGLAESISMIADALGWKLDGSPTRSSRRSPTETVASEFLAVDPGYVCGIVQDGVGYRDGEPVITLHMEAYLGAPESYDAVEITGSPALKMKIAGGVHGDIATASIVGELAAEDPRRSRPACTPCATCRCRRSSAACASARRQAGVVDCGRRLGRASVRTTCPRPQRRRFRNSPFREMPSSREASSTRPCVRSSARRTIICSSMSTAAGSG